MRMHRAQMMLVLMAGMMAVAEPLPASEQRREYLEEQQRRRGHQHQQRLANAERRIQRRKELEALRLEQRAACERKQTVAEDKRARKAALRTKNSAVHTQA